MYIAAYKGKSSISKLIKFFTRAEYSHVSLVFSNKVELDEEFEAWHKSPETKWYKPFKGYFQQVPFGKNHEKGTEVDIFKVTKLNQEQINQIFYKCREFARKKTPYDIIGCTRFLTKVNRGNAKKLFCSESIMTIFNSINFELLKRVEPWQVSPGELIHSTELDYYKTIKI
jgi:hypothetical protein